MKTLALLVALSGCNLAFGLTETQLRPDAQVPDDDHDGIDDAFDNCVGVANPNQSDLDHDTHGDACDNCPLIANPGQEHVGDADALGDLCDPHPVTDGDCPLLLDAFTDPSQFGAHWRVQPNGSTAVTPVSGSLEVARTTSVMVTSTELANDPFDVSVLARATLAVNTSAQVMALTNATTIMTGDGCAVGTLFSQEQAQAFEGTSTGANTYSIPLSSPPVSSQLLLRLSSRTPTRTLEVRCRVDHGIAFGFSSYPPPAALTTGAPGVAVFDTTATIYAIQISRFQPGVQCPMPVIR